jgi:hypothetical protein
MPNTYLFYVDESGQREYGRTSRYFALCGLGVPVESWQLLNNNIHTLKLSYFGTPSVEIKSVWLRQPEARKKHYLDLYSITEAKLQECITRLYEILDHPSLALFASVVDKTQMTQMYTMPQNSSSLAYRHIFERFQHFLESQDDATYGMVIFDKIHDAAFRTKGYENLLTRQHLRYLQQGTDFVQIDNIVEGLLFISSSENNFVQLADLCAYNLFRQFKDHGRQWDNPTADRWPLYSYFSRIVHQFYTGPGNVLSGFGIKKYPDHKKLGLPRINWVLAGDEFFGWGVYQGGCEPTYSF